MKLIVRFRVATVFFAIFLSFYSERGLYTTTNVIIISCLVVSNLTMLYFTRNEEREKAILVIIMMESIGIGIILVNASSYFGNYFWMLLNPILLSVVKLKGQVRNTFLLFSFVLLVSIGSYDYFKTQSVNINNAHVLFGLVVVLCFVVVIAKIFDQLHVTGHDLEEKNKALKKSYIAKRLLSENLLSTTSLMDDLTYAINYKQSLEVLADHFREWDVVEKKFLLVKNNNLTEVMISVGINDLSSVFDLDEVITSSFTFDDKEVVFGVVVNNESVEEVKQHLLFIKKLFVIQGSRLQLLNYHDDLHIEKERNRIAEQIHDQVNQKLFASSCLIYNVENQIKKYNNELLNKQIDTLRDILKGTNTELKEIVYKMSLYKGKRYLQRDRLISYINDLSVIYGIGIQVNVNDAFDEIADEIKYNLFRVMNEAIVNSVNHGKCNEAIINLDVVYDQVILEVFDNGCGFDQTIFKDVGLGLRNMKNITHIYDGTFEIKSKIGEGTKIKVVIS